MGSTILQTKLNEVKSFMDNGSFVFTFKNERPFAIHEDQLFKNQLATESIDVNGHIAYKRNAASDVRKLERIIDFHGDTESGFGFLYDNGALMVPVQCTYLKNTYKYGYIKFIVPDISVTVNDIVQIKKDSIIGFDFDYNTRILYILSNLGYIYKYDPANSEELFDTTNVIGTNRVKGVYKCKNEMTKTFLSLDNKSEQIIKLFYGYFTDGSINEEGLYLLSNKGNLYFRYDFSSSVSKAYNFTDNFSSLKKIYSKYKRTFFLFKGGSVKILGDNVYGSLGYGDSSTTKITSLTKLGIKLSNENTTYEKINALSNAVIKDISIGKYHTLFLLSNGTAIGFGNNANYQLSTSKKDTNTKYDIDYADFNISNTNIKRIKATKYGSIFLTYNGRMIVFGTFLNFVLGMTNECESFTDDSKTYAPTLKYTYPITLARTYEIISGQRKLYPMYHIDLVNTTGDGVFVYKENGMCYYTGENTLYPIGPSFGNENVSTWTPMDNNTNDIMRTTKERPTRWTYYDDFVLKTDKFNGNQIVDIFYKNTNGVWIDWISYVNAYKNVTIKDSHGTPLSKTKNFYALDGKTVIKTDINFETYQIGAKDNGVEQLFKINKKIIPTTDYIDANLNVWTINAGDNYAYKIYTKVDADKDNTEYTEKLEYLAGLKATYRKALDEETEDMEKIETYQNKLAEIEVSIKSYQELIAKNNSMINKIVPSNLIEFPDTIVIDPMKKVGEEEKNIIYSHSVISEPTGESLGVYSGEIRKIEKTTNSYITKLSPEFVDLDAIKGNIPNELFKDDIKLTLIDEADETKNYNFDQFLVWMNGRFINKDYFPSLNRKSIIIKDGMSITDVRRICEYPGLKEPTRDDFSVIPHINADTATVVEPTYPTELRWDMDFRLFGWKNINIEGPYKIRNGGFNSEVGGLTYFYYGDAYVPVYTKIRFSNREFEKGSFILLMNGFVIPENEYDVTIKSNGETVIDLKTFVSFIARTLQEEININDPGYHGHVKKIIEEYCTLNQFAIAFFKTSVPYKKVRLHYDYQTIRNYPKPGEILFRDIKYNDLILVDGHYIPYIWEGGSVISFPDSIHRLHDSENDFINHSSIYKIHPYLTYKREDEMTDVECRSFVATNDILTASESKVVPINTIRTLVRNYIKANNLSINL